MRALRTHHYTGIQVVFLVHHSQLHIDIVIIIVMLGIAAQVFVKIIFQRLFEKLEHAVPVTITVHYIIPCLFGYTLEIISLSIAHAVTVLVLITHLQKDILKKRFGVCGPQTVAYIVRRRHVIAVCLIR